MNQFFENVITLSLTVSSLKQPWSNTYIKENVNSYIQYVPFKFHNIFYQAEEK